MFIEDKLLHTNFKGEPWALPRTNVAFQGSPVDTSRFQRDLKPMLLLLRMLGLLPLYFESSGQVKFKLLSLVTLYCIAIQAILFAAASLTLKERIQKEDQKFNDKIVELGVNLCFLPAFLGLLTHLPETEKKIRFFNNWDSLQRAFHRVTGRKLILKLGRNVKKGLASSFLVAVIFIIILYFLCRGYTWWQTVLFGYCYFVIAVMTRLWVLINDAFVITADQLEQSLRERLIGLSPTKACTVAGYHHLWLQLSKQTQDLGNAMGYTYGGQVVLYFAIELVGVFGFISQVQSGNLSNTSGFLTAAITFFWLIHVFCNAAGRTTNLIGVEFQDKLRNLFHGCSYPNVETKAELRNFVDTITAYPPEIELCGFVVVDRRLQTSLVSSIVTYLVVLAQFQVSSSSEEDKNKHPGPP